MLLAPCSGHYIFPPLNWIGPSILVLLCVTMEFTTRYMFYNGYTTMKHPTNKCQTILHNIPISTVTISPLDSLRAVPGVARFRFTPSRHSVWGSNQTGSCGIPLQLFHSLLHPSEHISHNLSLHNRRHSSPQLSTSDKYLTTT